MLHRTPPDDLAGVLVCLRLSEVRAIFLLDTSPLPILSPFQEADPRIIYLHVPGKSFGEAHNLAVKSLKDFPDGYHLVMGTDILWDGNVIEILAGYLESNPDVGMVVPKILYPDGTLQTAYSMLPTPLDFIAAYLLPEHLREKRLKRYRLAQHDPQHPLNTPSLSGNFMLFRNRAIMESGMFDERFSGYPDHIDLTRRIHEKWKTMYLPGVSIVNFHKLSRGSDSDNILAGGNMSHDSIRNILRYFNKWGWMIDGKRRKFNRELLMNIASSGKS